jgi:enoyl-CoA hydratase/carnithine racemase
VSNINLEKEDGVWLLTINREDKMNSLDFESHFELVEMWKDFSEDPTAKVGVITGAGEHAFCAGADLKTYTMDFATRKPNEFRDKFVNGYGLGGITRGLDIDKPLIAAINGYAVSGGLEIALACDLRFCSETAKFGLQDVKWGFHACDGALVRLPHIVGMGATMELVLSGELINAEHAHKINLVNKIYANNSLLEKTLEYAHLLAKRAPLAIKFAKQTLRNTVSMPLADALRHEVRSFYDLGQSEDLAEGTRAFRERREAKFKGR